LFNKSFLMDTSKTFDYLRNFADLETLKRNLQAAQADYNNAKLRKADDGEIYSKLMVVMGLGTTIRQVEDEMRRLESETVQELDLLNRQKRVHDFTVSQVINGLLYSVTLSSDRKLLVTKNAS
jgi:hypothetical protein